MPPASNREPRPHRPKALAAYDRNVFLNLPLDTAHRPILDAILFTSLACGLRPRSVLEVSDSAELRFDRIRKLIQDCRWSIHDLSGVAFRNDGEMPRFNVALELGMFLGARSYGDARQRRKACLVLDRDPFRSHRVISDVAGFDVVAHHGEPEKAIGAVRDWLASILPPVSYSLPTAMRLVRQYRRLQLELPRIFQLLHLSPHELTFEDAATLMSTWIRENADLPGEPRVTATQPVEVSRDLSEQTVRNAVRDFVAELTSEEREARSLAAAQRAVRAET